MATSTIFTNITISKSDEVELFLDALEKSEKQTSKQSHSSVEFTENHSVVKNIINRDKLLDV